MAQSNPPSVPKAPVDYNFPDLLVPLPTTKVDKSPTVTLLDLMTIMKASVEENRETQNKLSSILEE
ncbi:Hypothetical protein CINCED_3A017077, partial [Cinara cedri]